MQGPKHLGGAGFTPLQAIAGSGHVLHFLKHWRSPTERACKILRIVTTWAQYQSGLGNSILIDVTSNLSYVDGRFIQAVRAYLESI